MSFTAVTKTMLHGSRKCYENWAQLTFVWRFIPDLQEIERNKSNKKLKARFSLICINKKNNQYFINLLILLLKYSYLHLATKKTNSSNVLESLNI